VSAAVGTVVPTHSSAQSLRGRFTVYWTLDVNLNLDVEVACGNRGMKMLITVGLIFAVRSANADSFSLPKNRCQQLVNCDSMIVDCGYEQ
jgi:hypothetical protein